MTSDRDKKTIVDGSCLTDATCTNMVNLDKFFVNSTVHVALIARYMHQFELVYTAPDRTRPVDVLDVGCNNGAAIRLYASQNFQTQRRKKIKYTGIDLNEKALADAEANRPKSKIVESADFLKHDFTTTWPFPDNSFDALWYTEAIEHVPENTAQFTLHEAIRVLRPGGVMLLSTPAPFDPEKLVWPESHDHEFSREEMREMIDVAGFERFDEYGLNTNWTYGRKRLRELSLEKFHLYETLRSRLGGTIARTMIAALVPEVCDDLVHMCRKPSND